MAKANYTENVANIEKLALYFNAFFRWKKFDFIRSV